MIYTVSVLRGYEASKGFIFISLAFFIGTFTITIPSSEEQEKYSVKYMDSLVYVQQTVHLLASVQSLISINLELWRYMELLSEAIGRLTVMMMIMTYMWQWQTFLQLHKFQIDDKVEVSKEMNEFIFWITLEILLLLAIAISNFIFLSFRSCL